MQYIKCQWYVFFQSYAGYVGPIKEQGGQHVNLLATLLKMNEEENKSHVAIRKILKYHPNIDMKPLFELDSDGEQTLKALPHVVDWFERAGEAVAGDIDNIVEKK